MTSLARRERHALADLAAETGPDAPTLCGDWTVRDLLAHLVVRESRPWAAPGILIPALSGLTEREMAKVAAWDFDRLVQRVRHPALLSPSTLPPVDAVANRLEFFIHHEDIRRAAPGWTPRELPASDQDALWQASRLMGPLVRRAGVPVVLQRTDAPGRAVLRRGDEPVVVAGTPAELVLFCYGREECEVELSGPPAAVEALRAAEKGI